VPGETGTENSQLDATISSTVADTMPLDGSDGWRAQGTASETVAAGTDAGTIDGTQAVGCSQPVDVTFSNTITGTTPGPFYIDNLAIDPETRSVALTFAFLVRDEHVSDEVGENVDTEYDFTAPAQCTGTSSVQNHVSDTAEDVRYYHTHTQNLGNTYQLPVPPSAWTFSPTWTAEKGGTLATASLTYSEVGEPDVTETFVLSTPAS
jgi:hypothetical protein